MKKLFINYYLCALSVLISLPALGDCIHSDKKFSCAEYLTNYDADTITFNIPGVHPIIGKKISIRLAGIDTPELRTKNKCEKDLAQQAKNFVMNTLKAAKSIELHNIERGKYFRIVADVIYDGQSLSSTLLKKNYGTPYDGGKKATIDWCNHFKLAH